MGRVVVGSSVGDADCRFNGGHDADMGVFAVVDLADDGTFAASAGAEYPIAHGDIRRGFGGKSGEWQEEQEETGHSVFWTVRVTLVVLIE